MTNAFIQVPPDSTGKKLFTQQHTVGVDTVQVQGFNIVDSLDPTKIQRVDNRGQASIRFAEGSPTLDGSGNLRTAEQNAIAVYEYSTKDYAPLFTDNLLVGGSATFVQAQAHTTLAVTSSNGSTAIRTSNRYHYYQPGVGMYNVFTMFLSDNGKVGNTRCWGYGDSENGLFFELVGTTLSVIQRSNITGTVVETRVNRTNWNGDKLLGDITKSGMTLDLSMANYFFIDFIWFGVGPTRFGIIAPDGSRWVCHTFENPNAIAGPYMRTGTLPVRYENYNTAGITGTAEMYLICTGVYAESKLDYTFWRYNDVERLTPVTVTTNTPILSIKVKAGSRVGIYPETLNLFVTGGNVKISLADDGVLTGATWTLSGTNTQGDIGATAITSPSIFNSKFVPAGVTEYNLVPIYELNDEGIHRLADDSDSYVLTVLATKLDGTTVTVGASLNYRELS